MTNPIQHRYDFALLFDVQDGNPNGDPDAGNLPRVDPETGHGLVTDVCLKRKIRNFVSLAKEEQALYKIFVKEKAVLNHIIESPYSEDEETKKAVEAYQLWSKDKKKHPKPEKHYEDVAKEWLCKQFYDIRTFGAVMSTSDKASKDEGEEKSKIRKTAGQVRGAVQLTFARSITPVLSLEHSITRMAVTNEKDIEKERTMGRKHTLPYGLYMAHGFISAHLAQQTCFSEDDLQLLWQALGQMFDHDHSAARGLMSTRGLYIFKHDSKLGNAPAHSLFDRIKVEKKAAITAPRQFSDYQVTVEEVNLPAGVTLQRLYEPASYSLAAAA